ncbi:MAG: D-alanyl-D-alanine carboxypeptidase [Eubacteriaceae bacterium]|nr:D-alanyl-D-alanine carboxypeptidase [Eubacteriaceae bacterium]
MKTAKKLLSAALALLLALSFTPGTVYSADFDLAPYSSIGLFIYEETTGTVLLEKNAHTRLYPGSITKIMTTITALDYMDNMEEKVRVTSAALGLVGPNSSTANLSAGEELTFRQLIYATLIPSGNDAAIVTAVACGEKILGKKASVGECYSAFLEKMNEKSLQMGLTESHWANADGYDNTQNYSTAFDIVTLGRAASKMSLITETVGNLSVKQTTNTATHEWKSTNVLKYETLPAYYGGGGANPYYSPLVTGMKTGYTKMGQKCFLMTATDGKMNIIGAFLNVPDDNKMEIWQKADSVLDYVFKGHAIVSLITDENRSATYSVANPSVFQSGQLAIYAREDLTLCLDKDKINKYGYMTTLSADTVAAEEDGVLRLKRDIVPGDVIGQLVFFCDGDIIAKTDMITAEKFDIFGKSDIVMIAVFVTAIGIFIVLMSMLQKKKLKKKKLRRKKNAAKSSKNARV